MKDKFTVVDLCCGAGGLSFGVNHHKRMKLVLGVDVDKSALLTYKRNHKTEVLNKDIKEVTGKEVLKIASKVDLLMGGLPCQTYSSLGKRDLSDEKRQIMVEFIRLVGEINPKVVLFENVKNFINFDNGADFRLLLEGLEKFGYCVSYDVLDASDFGVAQTRKRLFVVGSKLGKFSFERRRKVEKKVVFEVIGDLFGNQGKVRNHDVVVPSPQVVAKIGMKLNSSYKRLSWDKPAGTIVSSFGGLSGPTSVHPEEDRALTVREAARLQSFPDSFIFWGNKTEMRRQVANAVPPKLSVWLMRRIWNHVKQSRARVREDTDGVVYLSGLV